MKTIKRTLLISLVPLVTPLTALAQTGQQSERDNQSDRASAIQQDRKGSAPAWRASQVIGVDVKNAASETIGDVEDLIIDMKDGEILAVVISSGGFLGIGESLSAVPVAVLRYDERANGFKTKLTKEQLERAPQFRADAWPDYSDATSAEALRSFRDSIGGDVTTRDNTRIDRDTTRIDNHTTRFDDNTTRTASDTTRFDDDATRDKDNTAQNEREMRRNSKTPLDQGNSSKDVKMTKDIRSDIMGTDMSYNAKNIKIITRDERVTLNGVVDSQSEHQAILKIAEKHSEQANITDNLKVKNN